MRIDISVNIGKLKLKNPVMVASGTFGYAEEFSDFADLNKLGAVVTKTITINPRQGNIPPRTCETPAGMLNSIGLENPGWAVFVNKKLPALKKAGVPVIVSIASEGGVEEFAELARRADKIKEISAIELNISCPNVRGKPNLVSQDPRATYEAVKAVRKQTTKALITKLSPNVTSIVDIALSAESAGSDALTLINTITGMSINIASGKPRIAMGVGGLSGPAIRPVAIRMVWEAYNKVRIPIIGTGGIMNSKDALEFIIAGASAVSVGTANFINPAASIEIVQGIEEYFIKNKIKGIKQLTGSLHI